MKKLLTLAALLVCVGGGSASAQYPVQQQTSYAMNASERANLQLVHDSVGALIENTQTRPDWPFNGFRGEKIS